MGRVVFSKVLFVEMILRICEILYFFLDRKDYISDSSDYKGRFNIIILEENARNSIRS